MLIVDILEAKTEGRQMHGLFALSIEDICSTCEVGTDQVEAQYIDLIARVGDFANDRLKWKATPPTQ
jgi:hypothetical protein